MQRAHSLRLTGEATPDVAAWQRLPGYPDTLATINVAEQSFYYVMQLYNYGPFDRMCVSLRVSSAIAEQM